MDKQALFIRMKQCGYTVTDMYNALNISRSAFYRKCNGLSEFTLKEVTKIMDLLGVEDANEIFFARKVS